MENRKTRLRQGSGEAQYLGSVPRAKFTGKAEEGVIQKAGYFCGSWEYEFKDLLFVIRFSSEF
jgi:hypothetical protein